MKKLQEIFHKKYKKSQNLFKGVNYQKGTVSMYLDEDIKHHKYANAYNGFPDQKWKVLFAYFIFHKPS